jgi:predicted nucleic acid-binding Zn ribbon protein
MFGKNHQKTAKLFAMVLGVVVIVSMVLSYFALVF